jgi:hypothetical protein
MARKASQSEGSARMILKGMSPPHQPKVVTSNTDSAETRVGVTTFVPRLGVDCGRLVSV